ncbi:MAG: hypothetical protein LIO77_05380, partial [Rikenellaceae bacterium]|nr:hypothetical protein [Rikenellaceae bacterium]
IKLNKDESVLVSGGFSREDMLALKENSTLLSAKVSYIRSTLVNLYVKGFNTYLFTSDGLFDIIVANVIAELNGRGLAIASVFIKPYPGAGKAGKEINTEDFANMSMCFCESKEDFNLRIFRNYLDQSTNCVLYPSRVKTKSVYHMPVLSHLARPSENLLS